MFYENTSDSNQLAKMPLASLYL